MKIYVGDLNPVSLETGRNGMFEIKGIEILCDPGYPHIYIDGVSRKKGVTLRGGFVLDEKDLDRVCKAWMDRGHPTPEGR